MRLLVTGIARSGTSLTARVLDACGAAFGQVNELHEHPGVRDGLVKPYLHSAGADSLGQWPLPRMDELPPAPSWRVDVLQRLGGATAFKCVKSCLVWPVWHRAFPDVTWIIVRRERERLIDSCLRAGFLQAFDDPAGWGGWIDRITERLDEIRLAAVALEVWPLTESGVHLDSLRELVAGLGLRWDASAVDRALAVRSP